MIPMGIFRKKTMRILAEFNDYDNCSDKLRKLIEMIEKQSRSIEENEQALEMLRRETNKKEEQYQKKEEQLQYELGIKKKALSLLKCEQKVYQIVRCYIITEVEINDTDDYQPMTVERYIELIIPALLETYTAKLEYDNAEAQYRFKFLGEPYSSNQYRELLSQTQTIQEKKLKEQKAYYSDTILMPSYIISHNAIVLPHME